MSTVDENQNERTCPHCGNPLPDSVTKCPHCGERLFPLLRTRETVILLCVVLLVALFFVTGFVAKGFHQKLAALGQQWFVSGEQQLKLGNATQALADFRNALVYAPDDDEIQLRLALALAATGHNSEASSYLLGLLAHAPANAPVNLALARIAVASGSEADALRYYHGAIYGVWPDEAETNRVKTRLELCQFLISHQDTSDAESELIALASDIPREGESSIEEKTGDLFLQVGDANRALTEFRDALASANPPAGSLHGAGISAFQLGRYSLAESYLERASHLRKYDPSITAPLEMSRLILAWNPYIAGVGANERQIRVRHDFEQAFTRLQSCAEDKGVDLSNKSATSNFSPFYSKAVSLRPLLTPLGFRRNPGLVDATMSLVFGIEDLASQQCGPLEGLDQALVLIGKSPRNVQQ